MKGATLSRKPLELGLLATGVVAPLMFNMDMPPKLAVDAFEDETPKSSNNTLCVFLDPFNS
jgi:hypothetical protein